MIFVQHAGNFFIAMPYLPGAIKQLNVINYNIIMQEFIVLMRLFLTLLLKKAFYEILISTNHIY